MMRSALRTVARRCAMTSVVRPRASRSSACATWRSLSASSELVASSSSRIGRSASSARAIEMRWRWPPESLTPRSPRSVSKPCGRRSMNSSACAAAHASRTMASVASGRPKRTFSVTLAAKITGSCGTSAIARRTSCGSQCRMSAPSSSTRPRRGIVEAQDQREHRGLPRARGPDQRDALAGVYRERDRAERDRLRPRRIGERDVVEADRAGDARRQPDRRAARSRARAACRAVPSAARSRPRRAGSRPRLPTPCRRRSRRSRRRTRTPRAARR